MTVHLLGTGSANAGPTRTTTMLAVEHGEALVLVDCGADAVQQMLRAELDPTAVDAVILTHEHPDHISGYPLLLEKLWLLGRRQTIPVFGPAETLAKARRLFDTFNVRNWEGLPDRAFHEVPLEPGALVIDVAGLHVTSTPVDHPVPTIGLRFESSSATVAYSCDTAPAAAVVALARGADLLIHEGTGSLPGVHSSPLEAARIAAEAETPRLVLVHAPVGACDDDLAEARELLAATTWGEDGDRIEL